MWYNKLDPPLGGRRSRNSHYTTSFKKSQIKSSRRIAQSFFPKSLFFVQPAQPASAGAPPTQSPYATPFVWQPGPGRICPPRRKEVGPSKIFLSIGRPARRVNFPIWPQHCQELGLSKTCFAQLSLLEKLVQQQRQNESSRAKFTSHENLSVSNLTRQIDLYFKFCYNNIKSKRKEYRSGQPASMHPAAQFNLITGLRICERQQARNILPIDFL